MRIPHYIQPAKGERIPRQLVAVDCTWVSERAGETIDAFRLSLLRGSAIRCRIRDGRATAKIEKRFTRDAEFWEWLRSAAVADTCTWVVGFDVKMLAAALGLWQLIEDGNAFIDGNQGGNNDECIADEKSRFAGYTVLENPPNIIVFRLRSGGTINMVDVKNYGVGRFADLLPSGQTMEAAGCEIVQGDDYNINASNNRCRVIFNWFTRWIAYCHSEKIGSFQATAGGLAWETYRHKFMAKNAIWVHDCDEALDLERKANYGGRCEAAFIGRIYHDTSSLFVEKRRLNSTRNLAINSDLYHVDVNSLYPFVAATNMLPVEFTGFDAIGVSSDKDIADCKSLIIADVTVNTSVPCVPVRIERDDYRANGYQLRQSFLFDGPRNRMTIWPVGRFRTQLCGPELELARKHGKIEKVHAVASYVGGKPFDTYIRHFFRDRLARKMAGDKAGADVAKAMLVSLFGRFAMRSKRWVDVPEQASMDAFAAWHAVDPETGIMTQWRSFCWRTQKLVETGETKHSCPAITAWIASLGRVVLWNLIETAGQSNTFYVDTDALIVNREGFDRLKASWPMATGEMGALKIVEVSPWLEISGWKHYRTENRFICAGLPADSVLREVGVADVKVSPSIMSDLWKRESPQPIQIERSMTIPSVYLHGKVWIGGEVTPFNLDDGKGDWQ